MGLRPIIRQYLGGNGWKYDEEGAIFVVPLRCDNTTLRVYISVSEEIPSLTVRTYVISDTPEPARTELVLLANILNQEILSSVHVDKDGDVVFGLFVVLPGLSDVDIDYIETQFYSVVDDADTAYPMLMAVLHGGRTAAEAWEMHVSQREDA